jgi:molybdate transport system regulatory protein
MKPRLKVWVVFRSDVKLGDGRAHLLEAIDELGSIKKAVAGMGMSYRNAWGYLRDLEQAAGFKLLERRTGPGGGTHLTPQGRAFLKRYWHFRRGLEEVVDNHFRRCFPA